MHLYDIYFHIESLCLIVQTDETVRYLYARLTNYGMTCSAHG